MAQQGLHLYATARMQPSRKEPFHPVCSQEGPEEGALMGGGLPGGSSCLAQGTDRDGVGGNHVLWSHIQKTSA